MKRLTIGVLCCSLLLTGCGKDNASSVADGGLVTIEGYTFQIPDGYTKVASNLVENKQLINKIIGAFKLPDTEKEGVFEPNIIMTRSEVSPQINFEQFRTLNNQKLASELAGYQPGSKEVIAFTCQDRTVQGLLVYFRLQDPRYKPSSEVWMAQYQFVDREVGYIISAAYATESGQKDFRDLVDSLSCAASVSNLTGNRVEIP